MIFNDVRKDLLLGKWASNSQFLEGNKVRWDLSNNNLKVLDENNNDVTDKWRELEDKIISGDFILSRGWESYDSL